MMNNYFFKDLKTLSVILFSAFMVSCGGDDDSAPAPDAGGSDFGKVTSAVVIVNPKINKGSTTAVTPGTQREGVNIKAGALAPVATDATGLAVIQNLPVGTVPFQLSSGSVDLSIVQEKELYDLVLSYTSGGVEEIVSAIRYPLGGTIVSVKPGDDLSAAVAVDGAIVFMAPGVYEGDLEVTSEGVLLFGSWDTKDGSQSIINGNLTVKGGNVRMRGVTINEAITVNANGFSAAFCEFNNANITGNSVSLLRNAFTGTNITVPSSSAILVDNDGIE